MIVRTVVLIAYMAVLVVAFTLQLLIPALAVYVFYGLLFWLVASFFVFRLPGMSRPVPGTGGARGSAATTPAPPLAGGSPLPHTAPLVLGFCAYCGKELAVGATTCPSCAHPVHPI